MNVLIVDDDRFVVAALIDGINWNDLGFTNIYSACNIKEAMSIIERQPVSLLLCDIDMPHGSGLDLLAWIRNHHHDILAIFLTNYANFEYAQKAVELKSFHYYLKPIEYGKLSEIIRNATQHLTRQNMQMSAQYEHFWNAFVHKEIADDRNALEKYIRQMQLPYTESDLFLPVIFNLFPYFLTKENELESCFDHESQQLNFIKSTFQAAFTDQLCPYDIFFEYDSHHISRFLAVFHLKTSEIPALLSMYCETFMDLVLKQLHCIMNCFIGIPSQLDMFLSSFEKLHDMASDCLDYKERIYLFSSYRPALNVYPEIKTKMLEFYLENNQFSSFLEYCHQYLQKLSNCGCLNRQSVTNFQVDISQVIYAFLKNKGIYANKLYHGDHYHTLSINAKYSVHYMEMFLQYMITIMQNYLKTTDEKKSIAMSIKEYVDEHYAENIHRDCLTDIFFLDPNYASKIFKKEMGISFKDYIIQKRIDTAKDLLQNTNLPVNTVANNVGYDNYSYFSRIFKKVTDMTPIEYRNKETN